MKNMIRGVLARCAVIAIAVCLLLSVVSCGVIERVGEWIDENPLVAQLAVSQAVARYIEGGDSDADINKRRDDVVYVMSRTLEFIDTSTEVRADQIFDVFMGQVDWGSLTVADRLLAVEAIRLVQDSIERRVLAGELNEDTVLVLRGIVQTAIDTARYF